MLLEVQHLSKSFPIEGGILRHQVGKVRALSDVSLEIAKGETLAIVGGSGCGKSTLARIVSGLIAADQGRILWEGNPMERFSRLDRARRIQMIFQDPFASLNPKLSVGTQLAEVAALIQPVASRVKGECVRLLQSVGLTADVLGHYPFQFSGGQRQRIAIARALAMNPQLLVADEPLSALDVSIQAQILDLFEKLRTELHLTLLFITHDLAIAGHYADRVAVLQDGRLVEEGPARATLEKPSHPYTQALLAAVPRLPC